MTWYSPQLEAAVRARLVADTGTGGLLNVGSPLVTAVYAGYVPETTDSPYVTFRAGSADFTERQGFRVRVAVTEVIVECVVPEKPATTSTISSPYDRLGKICDRVVGNWPAKAAGVEPDYGLDRWTPTLSGWECPELQLINDENASEEGVLRRILTFQVQVSQAGV